MGDPDYRTLPPSVRLDETITSAASEPAPEPDAVRNVDHHAATRDD